jgi:membrane protein involved in colicin uptake
VSDSSKSSNRSASTTSATTDAESDKAKKVESDKAKKVAADKAKKVAADKAKKEEERLAAQKKKEEEEAKAKAAAEKAAAIKKENDAFKENLCDKMPDISVKAQSNNVVYFNNGKVYTDINTLISELTGVTPESLYKVSTNGTTTITKAKVSEELYNRIKGMRIKGVSIQGLCPQKIDFFEKATTGGRRKRTTKRR